MSEILGYLTGVILLIGFIPYLRDIFRYTTKPERATWLIWLALSIIAFFSQLASGASWSLVLTGADTVIVLLIVLLSIKHGVGGLTKHDGLYLVAALLGLVAWYFTKQPMVALILVIIVDAIGAYLTIIKTYKMPDSETRFTWIMASIAGILGALAVGSWSFILLLYPIYIFIANGAVAVAIQAGKRNQKKTS